MRTTINKNDYHMRVIAIVEHLGYKQTESLRFNDYATMDPWEVCVVPLDKIHADFDDMRTLQPDESFDDYVQEVRDLRKPCT